MQKFTRLSLSRALEMSSDELIEARKLGLHPPIAGGAMESNINSLWFSKQSAKGSPADMTVGEKRSRWVGGDLNITRADGTEQYSDGTLFGNTVDFVNTLNGTGAPVFQGQSGAMAYANYIACGQEVVTGGTSATYTLTSTAAGGTWGWAMNGFAALDMAYNITGPELETAILAAVNTQGASLPAMSLVVTGPAGGPWVFAWQGALGLQPIPAPTLTTGALTGGSITYGAGTTGSGYLHTATPSDVGGFYSTWAKSVGKSVVWRGQFNDCRISVLRWEGSSASKVLKVTPTLLILDPGQIIAADPTQGDDGTRPFIYTEGAGSFTIDGEVYNGHSSFAMEGQWGLAEWYGDGVTPFDVTNTRATVNLQGITILIDAQGLARYNEQIYGTPTPATSSKPLQTIPALGSYSCLYGAVSPYTGLVSESAEFTLPQVKWDPNLSIPANPAGGPVELPMAAEYRKLEGQPAFSVAVTNFDPAYS